MRAEAHGKGLEKMLGIAAKIRRSNPRRLPSVKEEIAGAVDPDGDHLILVFIQMGEHRRRRAAGNRVLLSSSPEQESYGFLHTITSTAII